MVYVVIFITQPYINFIMSHNWYWVRKACLERLSLQTVARQVSLYLIWIRIISHQSHVFSAIYGPSSTEAPSCRAIAKAIHDSRGWHIRNHISAPRITKSPPNPVRAASMLHGRPMEVWLHFGGHQSYDNLHCDPLRNRWNTLWWSM